MSKKIAPTLRHAIPRPLSPREVMTGVRRESVRTYNGADAYRELRALLAVARAADRFLRSSTDDEDALRHADLFSAMRRLTRVSGSPSTVEGKRKPASNSSRPGRGRKG